MPPGDDALPDDIDALRAALAAEQMARREAEARASGAEAMVAHLKLMIARLKHEQFGASSERGSKLVDQMEFELEELEANAAEDAAAIPESDAGDTNVRPFTRRRPSRGPLPVHLPRERVVLPAPTACPCCGAVLAKLGETVTETLEVIPRQWKVIQTVREKFTCRTCETITQPPAPFHPISRGRAGPNLLAMILDAKFANHLPLNRRSEAYAREGVDLDVSTLADWVGACTATLAPLVALIRAHVMAADHTATTHSAGAGQGDDHRPAVDLCPRRPAVRWRGGAGRDLLLLARSRRRTPQPAPDRIWRDPAGRCLRRVQ